MAVISDGDLPAIFPRFSCDFQRFFARSLAIFIKSQFHEFLAAEIFQSAFSPQICASHRQIWLLAVGDDEEDLRQLHGRPTLIMTLAGTGEDFTEV
ncbi:hypothetical protein TIFTF001_021770 [Ficus carica]|uniref:Uncharacterized protein n=1 Tax=Ficus carica TaxID=3494 RepID=A0AA88AI35_FICCA|nr:hypothetical protein TIFTF001_021770 [Ficus carica]